MPRERVRVDPTTSNNMDRGEVFIDAPHVVATFHLPELEPADIGYHVGSRTISIWSRRQNVAYRTLVVLPLWVRSDQFLFRHKNGVYEFVLEPHEQPPALPT